MNILSEKELTVIDRIGDYGGQITQRDIAEHAGLSLGLTNIILKRLIKKGYLKVKQLTPKKMQYILTPKGVAEKTMKSYGYIMKTIGEMKKINESIRKLFINEYRSGTRSVGILGQNELSEIIRLFSPKIPEMEIIWLGESMDISNGEFDLVLDSRKNAKETEYANANRMINLFDYILKK